MTRHVRISLAVAAVGSAVVLAMLGQRVSPPVRTPTGSDSRDTCHVEAPDALRDAARHWCTNGLFARVSVTGDEKNVIAVAQFSANGAQVWQIQSSGLLASFRGLTNQMAAAAGRKDIAISVHDAADRRVAGCAREAGSDMAICESK